MNVMGKILVILNFVFALAVGGFLVVDFATRTNWHDSFRNLEKEMRAAEAHWRTMSETVAKYENNLKNLQQQRDAARTELVNAKDQFAADLAKFEAKLINAELQARDAEDAAKTAIAEKVRLTKENENLLTVLKQRDGIIVQLQEEIVKTRNHAIAMENQVKIVQDRNEQLLERNRILEKELVKKNAPEAEVEAVVVRGKPNPPSVYVEGKIDAVHAEDNGLVRLNVGSDKGLMKNQTLEVYRVNPPLYLGMIRITEVQPHHSFGRHERVGTNVNRVPLRVGDIVASSITRN